MRGRGSRPPLLGNRWIAWPEEPDFIVEFRPDAYGAKKLTSETSQDCNHHVYRHRPRLLRAVPGNAQAPCPGDRTIVIRRAVRWLAFGWLAKKARRLFSRSRGPFFPEILESRRHAETKSTSWRRKRCDVEGVHIEAVCHIFDAGIDRYHVLDLVRREHVRHGVGLPP